MVSVKSYTCAECGADVSVEGIVRPKITRSCPHDDAAIHANLEGRVFGEACLDKALKLSEIPEEHQEAFAASQAGMVGADGEKTWLYRDWLNYISEWHEAQVANALKALSEGAEFA